MQNNWNDSPLKLPEDQDMFSDLWLNRKANDIFNVIVKEQQKMTNGVLMELYGDSGASHAKTLLESCLSDLEYIKSKTGPHNEQLIMLSDTLAITVGLMVKMFAANIIIKNNTAGLKKEKDKAEIALYFLSVGEQVLKTVLSFNLSARARDKVIENFNAVKKAQDSLQPLQSSKPLEQNNEKIGIYIMIIITIIFAIFGAILGGVGGIIFCSCLGIGVGRVIGGLISGFIN
jgi:hypothetical protein